MALEFVGPADVDAMELALARVVQRHDVLRTTFAERQGQLLQRIPERAFVGVNRHQCYGDESECANLLHALSLEKFSLASGPVLRADWIVRPGSSVLALTMHHIATDGWSKDIVLSDLACAYGDVINGTEELTRRPAQQYGEYLAESLGRLPAQLERQTAYWLRQLSGSRRVELRAGRQCSQQIAYDGDTQIAHWPETTARKVVNAAERMKATPFVLMAAALYVLLFSRTAQTDLRIGVPIACRHRPESQRVCGPLMNLIVLRILIDGDDTFADIVSRVRNVALEAYNNQDVPIAELAHYVPQYNESREAHFEILLQYGRRTMPVFSGLSTSAVHVRATTSHHELSLTIAREPPPHGGMSAKAEYSTEVLSAREVAAVLNAYHSIVTCSSMREDTPVRELACECAELVHGVAPLT